MIITKRTNEGFVYAYIEWVTLFKDSMVLSDDGDTILVQNTWIHKDYRNKGILQEFFEDIFKHKSTKKAEFVFYRRAKYERLSNIYCIYKFVRKFKRR